MKIAKKRGVGYREVSDGEQEAAADVPVKGALISLSGAKGGVEVLTTDESEANRVHLKLIKLKQTYEDTYFEMAHLLWRIKEERLYTAKSLGAHMTFQDYVESELEFTLRKGQMLSAIWWWYHIEQGGDPHLLQGAKEIGWTKAYHLVRVVDAKNADEWFDLAKEKTERELLQCIKAALSAAGRPKRRRSQKSKPKLNPPAGMDPVDPEPGPEPEPEPEEKTGVAPPTEGQVEEVKAKDKEWTTFSVRVPTETKPSILEAIELAKKLADTHHEGYALSLMAQHFLSFSHDKKTVMIGEWLANFERNTGLTVIAVDPKDEKVVYGREHLAAVEAEEKGE